MAATITAEMIGSSKPWVARITGTDHKYGLARTFVQGARDYSKANSVRTRGVMTTWVLMDGLYEVNQPESWKSTKRYFARVQDGILSKIDAAEAMQIAVAL